MMSDICQHSLYLLFVFFCLLSNLCYIVCRVAFIAYPLKTCPSKFKLADIWKCMASWYSTWYDFMACFWQWQMSHMPLHCIWFFSRWYFRLFHSSFMMRRRCNSLGIIIVVALLICISFTKIFLSRIFSQIRERISKCKFDIWLNHFWQFNHFGGEKTHLCTHYCMYAVHAPKHSNTADW